MGAYGASYGGFHSTHLCDAVLLGCLADMGDIRVGRLVRRDHGQFRQRLHRAIAARSVDCLAILPLPNVWAFAVLVGERTDLKLRAVARSMS